MIITQDALIKQIADKEDINVTTIQNIFESVEDIIFNHLSSTAPSEKLVIKLLNGVSVERNYIEKKQYSKGMFQNIDCPEHVNIKANSSKYYCRRVNDKLFGR